MSLLQSYEQLRGKMYARRERMLEEREAGRHISVFFGALWLMLMELRSIVLRFLILNFSDPTESFKILLRLKPEDVCTYSYCSYRYLRNKVQLFSFAGTSMIIIGSVVGTFLLSIILPLLALRAKEVNWQSRPPNAELRKENLFTIGDWQRGFLFGTAINDNKLELQQGKNMGSGIDHDLELNYAVQIGKLISTNGICAGKPVASRFDIFDMEEQALTLRQTFKKSDCLQVGDEVAILYYNNQKEGKKLIGYDTNYIQGIRGRRVLLANKFIAKPSQMAVLARIPQFNNLFIKERGSLEGEVALVRAKSVINKSGRRVINLADGADGTASGAWLSPLYEVNNNNSFAEKIAWEGEAEKASDIRLLIGSGNREDALQWDEEELVGCTMRTPCKLAARHFNKKYIRCKIILGGNGQTPQVKNSKMITNIGFTSEATLVGVLDYRLLGMRIISPDVPNVLVQVRAGKTLADLKKAEWCGYNYCGVGNFFTAGNIKKTLSLDHDLQRTGHRWFQYRIFSVSAEQKLSQKLVRAIKLRLQSIPHAVGKL